MNRSTLNKTFFSAVAFHFLIAVALYLGLYWVGEIKVLPDAENIIAWDAINYHNLQHQGYIDFLKPTSNIPFFPLVALIWKSLNLSSWGAAALNGIFFLSGLYLLHRQYRFSFSILLLFLSIPSVFFFFVPYAEALFFLSSIFVILGLEKKNNWLVVLGLFLAAMTRPSMLFFIPAILFVEIIDLEKIDFNSVRKFVFRIVSFFTALILGFAVVAAIQYEATGDWLAFFHQRGKNGFQLPVFPLTTWRGAKLLWLDGMAFGIAFAALWYCAVLFFRKIFTNRNEFPSKVILLSLSFLSMTVVHLLFFNDKETLSGTSSLFGINRFVFATPFFLLLFSYYMDRFDFSSKKNQRIFLGYFVLILALLGIFKPSNHPEYLRPLVYLTFIASFLFFQKKYSKFWILVYVVNAPIQVLLLDKFLRGIWVG